MRLEIEKRSTPVAVNKPLREKARKCLHNRAVDNAVVNMNNMRIKTPRVASGHKSGITERITVRRNTSQNTQIPAKSTQTDEASAALQTN